MSVDRAGTIRRLKFLYAWQAVGPSSWGRFASLFYDSVGLSPSEIGIITGSMPAIRAVVMPLWGSVADRYATKKRVALLTQTFGAATLLLLAVPGLAVTSKGRGRFDAVWYVSIASACFASAGVLDAFTLEVLGKDEKQRFGEIRLWSAVTWGLSNFGMGFVADATGGFRINIAIFFACTMVSTAILAFVVKETTNSDNKDAQREPTTTTTPKNDQHQKLMSSVEEDDAISSDFFEEEGDEEDEEEKLLFSESKKKHHSMTSVVCFYAELFVIGAGMGLVERLLFVYIVEVLGGSYALCGLTVLSTVALEIPLFAVAKRVLAVLGHEMCFIVALLFYVPRVIGYTLITRETKEWIILLEVSHGVTFALMFTAAVDKAADLAPPGREATYQTLQNAIRSCLGAGVGAAAGGYYWQRVCKNRNKRRKNCRIGAVKLFRLAGAIVAIVLLLHLVCLLLNLLFSKRRRTRRARIITTKKSNLLEEEEEKDDDALRVSLLPDGDSDADELETIYAKSDASNQLEQERASDFP